MVLADTVGFVKDLPHELVAAFRSTLLEAREAHLHLHVIDAADVERGEHIGIVNEVLREIDAADVPQIEVYNKVDLLGEAPRVERNEEGLICRVWLSAATGVGLDLLREALAERFGSRLVRTTIELSPRHGRARAGLFRRGAVLGESVSDDGGWRIEVELAERDLEAFFRSEGLVDPAVPRAEERNFR
jgi:GTP-binding protein HflX